MGLTEPQKLLEARIAAIEEAGGRAALHILEAAKAFEEAAALIAQFRLAYGLPLPEQR